MATEADNKSDQPTAEIKEDPTDEPSGKNQKPLDANRYATTKTVAQGMLDVTVLSANAAQLKYVLHLGYRHEFYVLLMVFITISIVIQVLSAALSVVLAAVFNINKEHQQDKAVLLNNIFLGAKVVVLALNIIINVFYSMEVDVNRCT